MDLQSAELREGLTQLLQALTYVTKAENTRGAFHLTGDMAGKVLHIDVEELKQQGPMTNQSQFPSSPGSAQPSPQDEREKKIRDFLKSPQFQAERSRVGQFLALLSLLYRENRAQFSIVQKFNGRSRKYFAQSQADLEQSGTSVNPKNIPGSPYLVVTNNSTYVKGHLLKDVMKVLGYADGFSVFVASHIN